MAGMKRSIAIVSYGNEMLSGGSVSLDWRKHFRENICFNDLSKEDSICIARNESEWFDYLLSGGCTRLKLDYNHLLNNKKALSVEGVYIGGISWIIETAYNGHSDIWTCDTHYTSLGLYYVEYNLSHKKKHTAEKPCDIEAAQIDLLKNLEAIIGFAKKHNSIWFEYFSRTYKYFNKSVPENADSLIVLKNYSQLARQLYYIADSLWWHFITGKDFWCDEYYANFEDREKHGTLTKDLFVSVCNALVTAVNSN